MNTVYKVLPLILAGSLVSVGCVPSSQTGTNYSRTEARQAQNVEYGKIVDMTPVTIDGTKSGVGGVAGGALGGVAGSAVGDGKGSTIMSVIGAIAGAAAGAGAEEDITKQAAHQYTIKLQSGRTLSVVQADDPKAPLSVGDPVRLISQGSTYRITEDHANQ